MGIFENIDVSINPNNIIKINKQLLKQCCKYPNGLISKNLEIISSPYDKNTALPQNINIQLKTNNPHSHRIQKRRTSFNNYYSYKISETSTENMNKENYLKWEQSKSNTNEATLSNTNLFGQNSVNINKTINNNIINVNDNLMVINENNNINKDKNGGIYENNLILEIMTSWNLPEGFKLTIRNKHGLENSLLKRKEKEDNNIVYFGFQREEDLNTHPDIDYLLYPKEDFYDNKFIGKHFQIRYDTDNKLYYIKDLGFGFGTFIKLTNDIKIKDNFLINIGGTYLVFSLNQNENDTEVNNSNQENENNELENDKNTINIKVFSGDEKCDNYNFDFFSNPRILIGRNAFCDIIIEDKMLSRVHCSVFFVESEKEEERGWYLKDGNLNGKKSTNDTWFYSAEETLIENDMIFKTNHNLFKCIIQKEKSN